MYLGLPSMLIGQIPKKLLLYYLHCFCHLFNLLENILWIAIILSVYSDWMMIECRYALMSMWTGILCCSIISTLVEPHVTFTVLMLGLFCFFLWYQVKAKLKGWNAVAGKSLRWESSFEDSGLYVPTTFVRGLYVWRVVYDRGPTNKDTP